VVATLARMNVRVTSRHRPGFKNRAASGRPARASKIRPSPFAKFLSAVLQWFPTHWYAIARRIRFHRVLYTVAATDEALGLNAAVAKLENTCELRGACGGKGV